MNKLTILTPVREDPIVIKIFMEGNARILEKYPVIVVNRSGGEALKDGAFKWLDRPYSSFWEARKEGLDHIGTEYVLNLDANKILPRGYVEEALAVLELDFKIGVIAIDHEDLMGHLSFGTSIWRTELLKDLYDWRLNGGNRPEPCECCYMWSKVKKAGFKVETLDMRAIHLKEKGEEKIRQMF